jgi:hypothetical protein
MANSLAFGLMVATAIVLILVPALYCLYFRLTGRSEETTSPPPSTPAFVETYTPVVESLFDAELVASDQVSESA